MAPTHSPGLGPSPTINRNSSPAVRFDEYWRRHTPSNNRPPTNPRPPTKQQRELRPRATLYNYHTERSANLRQNGYVRFAIFQTRFTSRHSTRTKERLLYGAWRTMARKEEEMAAEGIANSCRGPAGGCGAAGKKNTASVLSNFDIYTYCSWVRMDLKTRLRIATLRASANCGFYRTPFRVPGHWPQAPIRC